MFVLSVAFCCWSPSAWKQKITFLLRDLSQGVSQGTVLGPTMFSTSTCPEISWISTISVHGRCNVLHAEPKVNFAAATLQTTDPFVPRMGWKVEDGINGSEFASLFSKRRKPIKRCLSTGRTYMPSSNKVKYLDLQSDRWLTWRPIPRRYIGKLPPVWVNCFRYLPTRQWPAT